MTPLRTWDRLVIESFNQCKMVWTDLLEWADERLRISMLVRPYKRRITIDIENAICV